MDGLCAVRARFEQLCACSGRAPDHMWSERRSSPPRHPSPPPRRRRRRRDGTAWHSRIAGSLCVLRLRHRLPGKTVHHCSGFRDVLRRSSDQCRRTATSSGDGGDEWHSWATETARRQRCDVIDAAVTRLSGPAPALMSAHYQARPGRSGRPGREGREGPGSPGGRVESGRVEQRWRSGEAAVEQGGDLKTVTPAVLGRFKPIDSRQGDSPTQVNRCRPGSRE